MDTPTGQRTGATDQGDRSRKAKSGGRTQGLRIIERGGYWHVTGTVRAAGRSVRLRRSTELPARTDTWEDADALRRKWEEEIVGEAVHGRRPSIAVAVAAHRYLTQPRARAFGDTTLQHVQAINERFGMRDVGSITESEWDAFVATRMSGKSANSRERFLNSLLGFLTWCMKRPRGWITALPMFDRDKDARNPNRRAVRPVEDLRPELIMLMVEAAPAHLRPQIAVMWSTGMRVNAVLHARLGDLNLAPGREMITFRGTKNGDDVTAALHPWTAMELQRWLDLRGRLHERDGPLFLKPNGQPYSPTGKGAQNRKSFGTMKRAAAAHRRQLGATEARTLRNTGDRTGARDAIATAAAEATLITRVTQHWFRHMLATRLLQVSDLKTTMAQGGWRDPRSALGYAHDVEEHRRQAVAGLEIGSDRYNERKRDLP